MKKTGYFFYTFLPLLVAFGILFFVSFFAMGMFTLFAISPNIPTDIDMTNIDEIMKMILNNEFQGAISCAFSLTCITVFGLWNYSRFAWDIRPQFKKNFRFEIVLALLLLVPFLQYICGWIVELIATMFPAALKSYEELIDTSGLGSSSLSVPMIVYSVLLAPIGEELIFRGVTLRAASRVLPFWLANLMQALFFGIFHQNLIQGAYAFFAGFVLGLICEKTGTIYYSMCLHFFFNLWGTVVDEQLQQTIMSIFGMQDASFVASFLILLFLNLVCGVLSLFLLLKGIKRKNQKELIPETHQIQENSQSS